MMEAILNFIQLLRKAGIKISPAEIRDCLQAVELVGYEREDFKNTLETTLIKEISEIEAFNKMFNLYFSASNTNVLVNTFDNNPSVPLQKASDRDGRGIGKSGTGGPAPDLLQVISSDDDTCLGKVAQTAIRELGDLKLEDAEKIRDKIHEAKVNLEWFMVQNKIENLLQGGQIDYLTYQKWQFKLANLQEHIEAGIGEFLVSRYGQLALEKIAEEKNLYEADFYHLDCCEVELIKKKISQLGRRLASRKSRRYKPSLRGKVDIKRIIRKVVPYNGIPLELAYKKKKINRPDLILICDISNSVAQFSSFMLQLVYVSQKLFKDVQSFVFVDHLSYVTPLFKKLELEEALLEVKYLSRVSETGCSHYGQTFFEFYNDYM